MRKTILLAITLFVGVCFVPAWGSTIYVDRNQSTNTQDGTSWANAWTNISDAIDDLASTNAVVQGGHTILIKGGLSYPNDEITLTGSHSGTAVASNMIAAVDGYVNYYSSSATYLMRINGAEYMVIDGIKMHHDNGGIDIYSGNNVIRNCHVYRTGDAIGMAGGTIGNVTLENCTICGNSSYGIYNSSAGELKVKNCIIVNNAIAGICEEDASADITVVNSCLYANGSGIQFLDEGTTPLFTASQINALSGCQSNVVNHPGFSGGSWVFDSFYTNSVCLGTATDGGNMGAYQSPTIVATSTNTYYVKPGGHDGNDGLSEATAWLTITHAAEEAVAGDTVIVKAGNYDHPYPTKHVTLTKNGSYDAVTQTELPLTFRADGEVVVSGHTYAFELDGAGGVVLDGFHCTSPRYGGIHLLRSYGCTIQNCTIATNGTITAGRGVFCERSYGNTVESCDIYGNTLAGVQAEGVTIRYCNVYDNDSYGLYLTKQDGLIQCSNIYSNDSHGIYTTYSALVPCSRLTVEECDLYANASDGLLASVGGSYSHTSTVKNCIFVDNGGYGLRESGASHTVYANNNCFTNNASANFRDHDSTDYDTAAAINALAQCADNIVADPLFIDPPDDLRLQDGSPCIDAGTATSPLELDLYGQPRVRESAVDIGSFEWQPPTRQGPVFLFD